jgi:inosine-uridine nucleoside N-ribohydrolase
MIVTEAGCTHMDIWRADNSGDAAEPLVSKWNAWVEAEAAKIATDRGLSPEMAAKRLQALRPHSYLKR